MSVQKEIEVILTRQLAGYLTLPIFIIDPDGNLLYFNEPAQAILGRRFEDTGEMAADEWGSIFTPTDVDGRPLAVEELPIIIALRKHRPATKRLAIIGLDGTQRLIDVVAFPLDGVADRHLGAVAMFWETYQE